MEEKLKEAQDFYEDRIIGWMIKDLKKSIPASTNFLTALGCLVYTEIIGNFLPKIVDETGSEKQRYFYRCLFRMKSAAYMKSLDRQIMNMTGKNIYQHFRHGMTHLYYPSIRKKAKGEISFIPTIIARDGKGLAEKKSPPIFIDTEGRVAIATKNYIEELEEAVTYFMDTTFNQKKDKWVQSATSGIDRIHQRN